MRGPWGGPLAPVVEQLFSSVVIVAVVTTVAAPVLLKAVVRKAAEDDPGFTDPSVSDEESLEPGGGDAEGETLQEPSRGNS